MRLNSLDGVAQLHCPVYSFRMELKSYLSAIPIDERDAFAFRCETSFRHLQNIAYGYKKAGEKLCINIERESNGFVNCEELRPDVDWQFLRGTIKKAA